VLRHYFRNHTDRSSVLLWCLCGCVHDSRLSNQRSRTPIKMQNGSFTTGVVSVNGGFSSGRQFQRRVPCWGPFQYPCTQHKLQSYDHKSHLACLRHPALTTSRNRFFTHLIVKADVDDQQVGTDRGAAPGDSAWRQTTVIQNR
jgi:hypothetical protein